MSKGLQDWHIWFVVTPQKSPSDLGEVFVEAAKKCKDGTCMGIIFRLIY